MGRLADKDFWTPQNQIHYLDDAYDLLGNMTTETAGYGSVYYAYNTAGRLTSTTSGFSGPQDPANVISAMHYNAFGGLTSATLGDNEAETYSYVPKLTRLQSYTTKLNTTTLYNFNIGTFAPNGDILAANDTANGNWTYSYDAFNRLVGSNKNSGQSVFSYVYDRFGNRWHQNGPHSMMLTLSGNNNRMDGYAYDAAGNLLVDNANNQYTYDAEGRIIMVVSPITGTSCYVYNADGQRVRKNTGSTNSCGTPATGTSVDYLYDLAGHQITELSSTGAWNRGEIYAAGRHLATYSGGTTYFIHAEWLGTERARSTASGAPYESCTSLPFGDWLTCSGGDPSPMHFTGKERDSESGLDNFGARYNSSNMGHFMSPDAFYKDSHVGDPQSWNEYAYARNNPLRYVDPNGETATVSSNCTTDQQNHTTCNVNISASITVYATSGSNLTQDQLNAAASQIQSSIQNAWSGSFTQDGVTYNVSTQISVSVAGSESDAMKSGAQNVIGLSNGPADPANNANSYVNPRLLSPIAGLTGKDTGVWNINTVGEDSAHEFTHLLGVGDRYSGAVLSNTNILNDPAVPHSATAADFRWGIREAINSVNQSRAMIGSCAQYCGLVPSQPRISATETVGAPWLWWK
jgi:RHS repeat-associated protein